MRSKFPRIFALILCLLAVASTSWAANNWAGSTAFAVWSLDDSSGLVLTDSIGNNDLTDYNTVGQDTVDYQEGNGCADFTAGSNEALYVTDANTDSGFPGRGDGSEMDFSVCFWGQLESVGANQGFIGKWRTTGDLRVFVVWIDSGDVPSFNIGHTAGTDSTKIQFGTDMVTGRWYHVGATYTASNNAMKLRIWDDTAGALLDSNATGTSGADMSPRASVVYLGAFDGVASFNLDGQLDEVVVFAGEALSDADIDKVRAGTYVAAGVTMPIFDYHYRYH